MRSKKSVGILFSGGKDSCLALHKAKQKGYNTEALLNVFPETSDSFMFHKPNLNLLFKQAEKLGIELIVKGTKGEKEKELEDLKELIKIAKEKKKIQGIVVGGIKSSYQGKRIKKICFELELEFIAPLWDYTPEKLWKELLDEKFKVILTKISCEGLSKNFLGKIIDEKIFNELKEHSEKYGFRLDFEGGEAETSVLGMPEFKNKKDIKIDFTIKSQGEYRHFLKIKKIE